MKLAKKIQPYVFAVSMLYLVIIGFIFSLSLYGATEFILKPMMLFWIVPYIFLLMFYSLLLISSYIFTLKKGKEIFSVIRLISGILFVLALIGFWLSYNLISIGGIEGINFNSAITLLTFILFLSIFPSFMIISFIISKSKT